MKNQYFGDEHDFKKYLLLRSFMNNSHIPLLVAWHLTPDEKKDSENKNDGNKRAYLENENGTHSQVDPKLFKWLRENHEKRDVKVLENALPNDFQLAHHVAFFGDIVVAFFSDIVPTKKDERKKWFAKLQQQTNNAKIIFTDPDNGIKFNSDNRTDSEKYIYFEEIEALWKEDKSLIVYQHRQFIDSEVLRFGIMMKIWKELDEKPFISVVHSDEVNYFFILQKRHRALFDAMRNADWGGLLSLFPYFVDEQGVQHLEASCK